MAWYSNNNIAFVPKKWNSLKCPELRPIEKYWAIVGRSMKKSDSAAMNDASMTRK
jgi:transposase